MTLSNKGIVELKVNTIVQYTYNYTLQRDKENKCHHHMMMGFRVD